MSDPTAKFREQGFVGDPTRPQVDPQHSHQQSAAEEGIDGLQHQQEDAREPAAGEGYVSDPTAGQPAAQDPMPEAQAAGDTTHEEEAA